MFDGVVVLEDSWALGWYVDAGRNRLVFELGASLWPGRG